MKKSIRQIGLLFTLGATALQSCKEDPKPNVPPINEGELITTLILSAKDSADGQIKTFVFKDVDGEGGNAPTQFDSILLTKGHSYSFDILLLDESKTETDIISNEVFKEGDAHMFVYTPKGVDVNIRIDDLDKNGLPIGLKSIWKTLASGLGKVEIALKHQPGIKNGDPLLGETDLDVEFNCRIK